MTLKLRKTKEFIVWFNNLAVQVIYYHHKIVADLMQSYESYATLARSFRIALSTLGT